MNSPSLHINIIGLAVAMVALIGSMSAGVVLVGRLVRQPSDERQLTTTFELVGVIVVALVGVGFLFWALLG